MPGNRKDILAPKMHEEITSKPVARMVGGKAESPSVKVHVPPPGAGGVAAGHTGYHRLLSAKQGIASLTAQPTHSSLATESTMAISRADAIITFATSIAANQPVATLYDRIRAFDDEGQFAEVEGRALPVSAYFTAYFRYLMYGKTLAPGFDKALANTTQGFGVYRTMWGMGIRTGVTYQDVIKIQPFTGTGAASAYSENDGVGAEYDDSETPIADYFIARAFGSGVSSLNIKGARAFLLAAANDPNTGFTFKAGKNTYVAEEINDAEQRINDFLGNAEKSLTGAASAAYNGARGQAQDPFTGAATFMFGDSYEEDTDISIAISTAQAVQIAVLTNKGIGAVTTG